MPKRYFFHQIYRTYHATQFTQDHRSRTPDLTALNVLILLLLLIHQKILKKSQVVILHELITENCDVAIWPKIQGLCDFLFCQSRKKMDVVMCLERDLRSEWSLSEGDEVRSYKLDKSQAYKLHSCRFCNI